MLERAGYIQRGRCAAVDGEGRSSRIVEAVLNGRQFGVRVWELRQALDGRRPARVEVLRRDWGPVLGGTVGRAEVLGAKTAITLTLVTGERYTVPIVALRALLARAAAFAPVAAVRSRGDPSTMGQALTPG